MYDVIVAGGGPAGCAAAITASRAGAKVLLLERGKFPRHKVCGEFVSAESLELLSSLIGSTDLIRDALVIPKARVFVDGHILETRVEPAAASIARYDLDAALWAAAKASGVDAREQVNVSETSGEGPFRLFTSAEDFEGRAFID